VRASQMARFDSNNELVRGTEMRGRNQRGSLKKKTARLNSGAMPMFVRAGNEVGEAAPLGQAGPGENMPYGEWKEMMKNRWAK